VTYYHVRITVANERRDETKLDLDEETLERQFLAPYRAGKPIIVNGKTIPTSELERIAVSTSEVHSANTIAHLEHEDQMSRVAVLGGPTYAWRAAARAKDVTDQFITGPPGHEDQGVISAAAIPGRTAEAASASDSESQRGPADAVFVVSGRDNAATSALTQVLRALGLRIVEWEHAVAKTGLPNPYVGDVVIAGMRMAAGVVVILTPDDLVQLRPELTKDDDGADERETRRQARPNVYYEAGLADALGRDRTVIVEIGSVKSFSDAAGRNVVRYDGGVSMRHALVGRLELAGLSIDRTGQDWLTVGNVSEPVSIASSALASVIEAPATATKAELRADIGAIMAAHAHMASRSKHEDFSDLPGESLEFVMKAQAIIDRLPSDSTYAIEVEQVRNDRPHVRIPVLYAALSVLRSGWDDS